MGEVKLPFSVVTNHWQGPEWRMWNLEIVASSLSVLADRHSHTGITVLTTMEILEFEEGNFI